LIGTLVNTAAIIIGSLLGCLLRKGLSEKLRDTISHGLGLCILVMGIQGALKTGHQLVIILAVVIGACLGTWIDIEKQLDRLGKSLQTRFAKNDDGNFVRGFVSATLLYCVGAMAIIGAMNSGLRGDHSMLYAKSILDGISSVIFASTMGIGVILSSVTVFLYQGSIALLAQFVSPILTETVVNEMSAAGSILIIGIGLNLLRKEHIAVGNMLPAIFLPILLLAIL
jgi:uncharacterized protein